MTHAHKDMIAAGLLPAFAPGDDCTFPIPHYTRRRSNAELREARRVLHHYAKKAATESKFYTPEGFPNDIAATLKNLDKAVALFKDRLVESRAVAEFEFVELA